MLTKRTLSIALACTLSLNTLPVRADLQSDMNDLFSQINNLTGGISNATAPGAYRSQGMGTLTGGSVAMRFPSKNLQLARIELPSVTASCNGIDLHTGSFSFIGDNYKAIIEGFGKNFLGNVAGYLAQLAIATVSPMLDSQIRDILDKLQKINNLSINSCELAQSTVNTFTGSFASQYQTGCQNLLQYGEAVADRVDGRENCTTRGPDALHDVEDGNSTLAQNTRRNADEILTRGNMVWEAFKQVQAGSLTDDDKQLMQSLVGTTVFLDPQQASSTTDPTAGSHQTCTDSNGNTVAAGTSGATCNTDIADQRNRMPTSTSDNGGRIDYYPPTIDDLKHFMFGDEAGMQTTLTLDGEVGTFNTVVLSLWRCASDPDNPAVDPNERCMSLTREQKTIIPFSDRVREHMRRISDHIQQGTALSDADIKFINATTLPVFKMLAVANMRPGMDVTLIDNYKDYIGAEYAEAYLDRAYHMLQNTLTKRQGRSTLEQTALSRLIDNIHQAKTRVHAQKVAKQQERVPIQAVNEFIMNLQQQMFSNIPAAVTMAMDFSRANAHTTAR